MLGLELDHLLIGLSSSGLHPLHYAMPSVGVARRLQRPRGGRPGPVGEVVPLVQFPGLVAGAGYDGAGRSGHVADFSVAALSGARGRTDVPKIVDWYMDGKINIDDLITHTMPLDDINQAFDLMHAGESIRSVVTY